MDAFWPALSRFTDAAVFVAPAAALALFLLLQWLGKAVRWLTAPVVLAAPGLCAALLLLQRPAENGVNLFHESIAIAALEGPRPREIRIGGLTEEGQRSADHLLLPGLAPDSLRLVVEGGLVRVRRGPGDAAGDVLVKQGDRLVCTEGELPRAVPLESGDILRGADGTEVAFSQAGLTGSSVALTAGGQAVTLERRKTKVPLIDREIAILGFQPWTRRLHPLAALPACAGWRSAIGFGFSGEDALWSSPATLLVRDAGLAVIRGGQPLAYDRSRALDALHLDRQFEILSPVLPRGRETPATAALPERWRVAGRFTPRLQQGEEALLLHLDLPAPRPQRVALGEPAKGEATRVVSVMDPLGFARQAPGARLDLLGREFQKGHVDLRFAGDDFSRFEVMGRSLKQLAPAQAGSVFYTDGDLRAALRVSVPWAAWERVAAVLLATGLSLLAFGRFMGCAVRTTLAAGLNYLLMARVVFAQAAEAGVPFDATAFPVALNLMFSLPVFVAGVDARCRSFWGGAAGVRAGGRAWLTLVAAAALVAGFATSELERAKLLASLVLPLLAGCAVAWLPDRPGFARARAARAAEWLERSGNGRFYGIALTTAAAVALARLLLMLTLGWKEAATLGGTRISLSIVFTPLFLALCCLGLARVADRFRRGPSFADALLGCLYQLALLVLAGATGFLISDLGAVIFCFPLLLLMLGVGAALFDLARQGNAPAHWPTAAAPALGFVAAPVLLLGALFFSPLLLPPLNRIGFEPEELLVSGDQISAERNKLRMLAFLDRGKLESMGTNLAEETVQVMALMQNYGLRGLTGEGFLNVPVHRIMAPVAENDNCAAIFLLAQFGTLGACGLCVAYLAFLAPPLLRPAPGDASAARLFGSLVGAGAALILCGTSLYMIAANLQLVPFTGRNMMLLSLNSLSDPLETMVMAALILFGVAAAEPRRA